MRDSFYSYHPIVNFTYFLLVLVFSMMSRHPVCLGISIVTSIGYSVYLTGKKAVFFNLKYMLPLMIMTALFNPIFNHQGVTILTYLPGGNPLTLESIIYGISASVMLISVITWFSCYNHIMTSDKFVYLFGRIIPGLSLIFSMTLRFVPKFKAQIKVISNAQKCVGRDVSNGNILHKIKHGLTIISIMITWALENAIDTSDSMRSRGYGLPGRSAFSIYRFDRRDRNLLIFMLVCGIYVYVGYFTGGLFWEYYPSLMGSFTGPYTISIYAIWFILTSSPIILNLLEDRKWRALKSGT